MHSSCSLDKKYCLKWKFFVFSTEKLKQNVSILNQRLKDRPKKWCFLYCVQWRPDGRGRDKMGPTWYLGSHDSFSYPRYSSPYKTFIFKCVKFPLDKGLYSLKNEGQFSNPIPFFFPKHHQLNNLTEFTLKANLVFCLVLQMIQCRICHSKQVKRHDQDIEIMTKYTHITIQVREKLTPEEK